MIADFLKGTVEESLKKLIQPAAVVPATIFVLLNLAFIYPAAKAKGVGKLFAGLDKTWQAVVVGAVILALGYILLNAANVIIDLLAGQSWRRSGLNWWLRQRQLHRRQKLAERIKKEEGNDKRRLGLRWELATHFPTSDIDKTIQATRLGNVLVATQQTIWARYGLDIAAFWAPMEATKEVKEAPAIVAGKDEKSTLDLLANLVFVLTLFGVEALVFFAARDRWNAALLSLLAFLGAYVAYRVAVESARSWGDAMQVVLDLHRDEMRKGLGLREHDGLADERALWKGARHLYLPGDDELPPDDLFEAKEPAGLKLVASSSLKVETVAVEVVDAVTEARPIVDTDAPADEPTQNPSPDEDQGAAEQEEDMPAGNGAERPLIYTALLRSIGYLLIATRMPRAAYGGVDLVVDDPRVRRVQAPPEIKVDDVRAIATSRMSGNRQHLHWRLLQLPPSGSIALEFRLPLWRVSLRGDAPAPSVVAHSGRFELAFKEGAGTNVVVVLESFAPVKDDEVRLTVNGEEEFMELGDPDRGLFGPRDHALVGNDKLWIVLPAVTT